MISLLFINCLLSLQIVDNQIDSLIHKEEFVYSDASTHKNIHMTEYSIRNSSTGNLYTWIDYNSVNNGDNVEKAIIYYLYGFHGDFSLVTLLTDEIYLSSPFEPIIGINFIKRIPPNGLFKYIVVNDNIPINDIDKNIFIISDEHSEFEFLKYANKEFLFHHDFIVLDYLH